MSLYYKYNNENLIIRAILAGLLDLLNNQIKYTQVWGDSSEDTETIEVPWYYNQSADERFNQDFYTFYAECMPPKKIDGNFDVIPRGIITYTGSTINAQRITSRYVQGRYVKELNGQLDSYVSYLYSIPLNVRIDCEIRVDRHITALKIEQEIREVFYKTATFYVYYKGLRIGSTVGFPEDVTIEKNIQYSFEADNKIRINFQLEIETYQPVFDPTTEMKATGGIKRFGYRLYPMDQKTDGTIRISSPNSGAIIPKGVPIWIEWIANSDGAIINKCDITWTYFNGNEHEIIQQIVPNIEYYIWNIPNTFTEYKEPNIIWEEDSSTRVAKKPIVKIIPDLNTKQITNSSFQIIDYGYFICETDSSMNLQLEMKDDNNNVSYTLDGAIWANISYNKLDNTTPISVSPDVSIYFPGTVDYKHINIYVTNSNNKDVFGSVDNIKII